MKIKQLDVTTAYLNGSMKKEVFMKIPNYFTKALEVIIERERIDNELKTKA